MNHECTKHAPGTAACYRNHACRCPDCRTANMAWQKPYKHEVLSGRTRTIGSTGTMRRLQALAAIGWSTVELARQLGVTQGPLWRLMMQPHRVRRETATRVAALYDRLWNQPPPAGRGVAYARNSAARKGWPPPLAWDDDTIDDPAAEPQGMRAHVGERGGTRESVAELLALGYTRAGIAQQLGITEAAVEQAEHRTRKAA